MSPQRHRNLKITILSKFTFPPLSSSTDSALLACGARRRGRSREGWRPPMFSSLVVVLASRRGSFSLPRRKEDYTFDRSTLQSVRASGCAGTALPPVFFLLTSTPNRADRLPVLLGTMRAQSHPPAGVVLTIPRMPPGLERHSLGDRRSICHSHTCKPRFGQASLRGSTSRTACPAPRSGPSSGCTASPPTPAR